YWLVPGPPSWSVEPVSGPALRNTFDPLALTEMVPLWAAPAPPVPRVPVELRLTKLLCVMPAAIWSWPLLETVLPPVPSAAPLFRRPVPFWMVVLPLRVLVPPSTTVPAPLKVIGLLTPPSAPLIVKNVPLSALIVPPKMPGEIARDVVKDSVVWSVPVVIPGP